VVEIGGEPIRIGFERLPDLDGFVDAPPDANWYRPAVRPIRGGAPDGGAKAGTSAPIGSTRRGGAPALEGLEAFMRHGAANPILARFEWWVPRRMVMAPRRRRDSFLRGVYRLVVDKENASELVRDALIDRGYADDELPSERTMRDILNRMNYRLNRIQKGKPLKKKKQTDAIVANVEAVRQQARGDPEALEISMDAKAKVALGDYVRGGKDPDRQRR
jgi:hypothetical protein